MGLKHAFKSLKADPVDTTKVGATKWNADHYFLDSSEAAIGAMGDLPYRGTSGLVTLLAGAQGVLTSAGSGNVPAWSMSPTLTNVTVTGSLDAIAYPFIRVSYLGDSIVNQPLPTWPDYLATYHPYFAKSGNATNFGISGARASALVTGYAAGAHTNRPTRTIDDGWFFLQAGGNDISDGVSAATVYGYLTSLWASARADGYKVVAMTVMPRASWGSGSAAIVLALNKLILSDTTLYDYCVRADLVLNDPNNALWFYDTTHPTELGAAMIAQTVAMVLNTRPWILSPSAAGGVVTPAAADLLLNPSGGNVSIGPSPVRGSTGPLDRLTINGVVSGGGVTRLGLNYDASLRNIRGVLGHGGNSQGINSVGGLQIAAQGAANAANGSGNINFFTTESNAADNETDASYVHRAAITSAGLRTVGATSGFGSARATGTLLTNDSQIVNNDAVIALGTDAVRGFLFVINHTSGAQGLFTLNGTGNAAVEVSDPAGIYTVTAGSSSSINVYWSSGNSRYELENKRGAPVTISLIRIGVGT